MQRIESWVWGPPLLILLTVTGLYLTFVLRGVQFRYLGRSIALSFSKSDGDGEISQFQSLMTALAGMIGIGSITGVATALVLGGLGSLFWMWVASILGMATKYAESILAVKYRTIDERGEIVGGPMYYLERGFKSKGLAVFFAIAGAITALGTGNMIQANSIAAVVGFSPILTGLILAALTSLALLGGIRSIGKVSSVLVPVMALLYIVGAGVALVLNYEAIPSALLAIVESAFHPRSAGGGILGFLVAVQCGVSRSVFSTEAGLGTAPIATAAAKTVRPAEPALVSMSGVFITSLIVCTLTGLVIAISGLPLEGGATLALRAFEALIPFGYPLVMISVVLFGFSTVISWAYYGERCTAYLFGVKGVPYYRMLYTLALIPGAVFALDTVWSFANIMNGLMAIPNLIAVLGLSSIVVFETKKLEIDMGETKPGRIL